MIHDNHSYEITIGKQYTLLTVLFIILLKRNWHKPIILLYW
ncbi:uncharacterized protein METZ01_LOCUS371665 [marine metagenome]|uniref:Uncharacterized protein n=1 Tax=marine metagenome TaxID=408172 RepID=A0A382TBR2_9ZZZZ